MPKTLATRVSSVMGNSNEICECPSYLKLLERKGTSLAPKPGKLNNQRQRPIEITKHEKKKFIQALCNITSVFNILDFSTVEKSRKVITMNFKNKQNVLLC
ncbi:hypothetical protein Droror1_Dr00027663 [Drosera rotundifolia]